MATLWCPDWPPASPSAYDDEFDDSSFDTGLWTEWDPSSSLTVSEAEYGLSLIQPNHGGNVLAGIFQAVPPSGDWAIWAKLSSSAILAGDAAMGLVLGQDLTNNPNTSDIYVMRYFFSDFSIQIASWAAYDGSGGTQHTILGDTLVSTGMYLRIRKASTVYSFDWSLDGIGWQQIYYSTPAFTPAEFGIMIDNQGSGADMRGIVSFFRCVVGTPAITDVMPGARIL